MKKTLHKKKGQLKNPAIMGSRVVDVGAVYMEVGYSRLGR